MKNLRHPPLLFWLVACLLLAGTLLLLHEQGRRSDQTQPHHSAVAENTRSDAGVEAFRLRLVELPKLAAGHNEALQVWAEQTAVDANRWARRHVNNPRTAELFEQAAAAAADLAAAAAGDSDGSSAAVAQLYTIGDLLTVRLSDTGTGN